MKMGSLLFLICCLLLARAASLAEFKGDEAAIYLDLYHVDGSNSSLGNKYPEPFAHALARDENRIKALRYRITSTKARKPSIILNQSIDILGPESVSIPVNSGLSLGSGNYYVKIGLGMPAKFYAMLLDTGSSLSWLQCQPCVVYCHAQVDPLYNPSTSRTYKSLPCSTSQCSSLKEATLNDPLCEYRTGKCVYTASYGDSSYSIGYLSQDSLSLSPSETLPRFLYGCGQDNEGLFGRAAGIVGLARQSLSMISQLSSKYGNAFSYCLPTETSTASGFLSLGRASLAASAFRFTPMITESREKSLYFLRLGAISLAGKPLAVAATQYRVPTIIDSGTVISRLPSSVYAALKQAFVKIMSRKYSKAPSYSILDTCFKGSLKTMSVPQMRLVFLGGADLALTPANILIDVEKGTTCLAFASGSGDIEIAIIGNHQQKTFKVAYDVTNARIGFAAGGCQ
ncbi:aspartyl protease family protein At5g10770-like [Syzygium oleosum]|uniref:aspartyl protease family protein At5g10770-like n=1 Tax=Syzygium oleosum TaxID=219896 RepID=UPI0011D2C54A|nr:aspartyl protease family protein At5g10770-like [Syzygium oleosum]